MARRVASSADCDIAAVDGGAGLLDEGAGAAAIGTVIFAAFGVLTDALERGFVICHNFCAAAERRSSSHKTVFWNRRSF